MIEVITQVDVIRAGQRERGRFESYPFWKSSGQKPRGTYKDEGKFLTSWAARRQRRMKR